MKNNIILVNNVQVEAPGLENASGTSRGPSKKSLPVRENLSMTNKSHPDSESYERSSDSSEINESALNESQFSNIMI